MKTHQPEYKVSKMAQVLGVSRSGYYRSCRGRESARALEDEFMSERIRRIHQESRATYGSPRITRELHKEGIHLGKNRVARLMRRCGIVGIGRHRKVVRTTRNDPRLPISPNLIKDMEVSGPNQVWVADITHIGTDEGWGYLAAVLDMWSRKIVGWSFKSHMESSLACEALENALRNRCPGAGLIHHSDRGSQYASYQYRSLLEGHEIESSMSAKGNCYDNATMESFFGTLKSEQIHRRIYRGFAEARYDIFDYVEVFYNRKRNHTSLEGWSPEEFELKKLSSPSGEEKPSPAIAGMA